MPQSEEQAESIEDAGPTGDRKKPNLGEQTEADAINEDDPYKIEKLSKLGHAGDEAAADLQ